MNQNLKGADTGVRWGEFQIMKSFQVKINFLYSCFIQSVDLDTCAYFVPILMHEYILCIGIKKIIIIEGNLSST